MNLPIIETKNLFINCNTNAKREIISHSFLISNDVLLYVYVMVSTLADFVVHISELAYRAFLRTRKALFFMSKLKKMKEKTYRSIAKTISWRTIGTIDTVLISWFVIGDITWAMSIGGVELFTKMGLYFLHERTWNKIKFGKEDKHPVDYHI